MGCGRCCRGEPGAIFFNQQEFNIIAKTLGISRLELREKYVTMRWGRPSFKERPNGDCIFYNSQKARCMIYPVRPTQCRTFPFWPEVLKSRESWDKFASRCPGMNEGELFLPSRILDFVEECNSWFEDKTGKNDK
ncbi:MAG: YkgJ family cysteine cluster protein [Synergistaceae bacterium]|nr:YkgJ family cysteine cluster protein [Synergistaceae bacterium]